MLDHVLLAQVFGNTRSLAISVFGLGAPVDHTFAFEKPKPLPLDRQLLDDWYNSHACRRFAEIAKPLVSLAAKQPRDFLGKPDRMTRQRSSTEIQCAGVSADENSRCDDDRGVGTVVLEPRSSPRDPASPVIIIGDGRNVSDLTHILRPLIDIYIYIR